MNKHTTSTIANNDNTIDINKSKNKSELSSAGAKVRQLKPNDNAVNTWNWRIETDTAELFIGMFG